MGEVRKPSAETEAMAPKKRAPRNPEARRQQIVNAAADLISREGSGKITHRKVAERAGVPLGSTTQYFKSIDELRHAGLAELAERIESEYDDVFRIVSQREWSNETLADAIYEYLSDTKRAQADAVLYAAAIEDPAVRDVTRRPFMSFLEKCEPLMDRQRAEILCTFTEGALIDSCFRDTPLDRATIGKAIDLILGD